MTDEIEIEIENLPEGTLAAYLSIERVAGQTVTSIIMGDIYKVEDLSMDASLTIIRDLVARIKDADTMFAKVWTKNAAEWAILNDIYADHAVYFFMSMDSKFLDDSTKQAVVEKYGKIIDQ